MPNRHPDPALLLRFLSADASPCECREVVRHLVAGCASCTAVTRPVWQAVERAAAQAFVEPDPYERNELSTPRRLAGRRS